MLVVHVYNYGSFGDEDFKCWKNSFTEATSICSWVELGAEFFG